MIFIVTIVNNIYNNCLINKSPKKFCFSLFKVLSFLQHVCHTKSRLNKIIKIINRVFKQSKFDSSREIERRIVEGLHDQLTLAIMWSPLVGIFS